MIGQKWKLMAQFSYHRDTNKTIQIGQGTSGQENWNVYWSGSAATSYSSSYPAVMFFITNWWQMYIDSGNNNRGGAVRLVRNI